MPTITKNERAICHSLGIDETAYIRERDKKIVEASGASRPITPSTEVAICHAMGVDVRDYLDVKAGRKVLSSSARAPGPRPHEDQTSSEAAAMGLVTRAQEELNQFTRGGPVRGMSHLEVAATLIARAIDELTPDEED